MPTVATTFITHGRHPQYSEVNVRSFSDRCGIQYIDEGGMQLSYEGKSFELEGCWCWSTWIGPQFNYSPLPPSEHWAHRFVTFTGPRVDEWIEHGLFPFAPQSVTPDLAVGARLDRIMRLIVTNRPLECYQAVNQVEDLLLLLAQERVTQTQRQPVWLDEVLQQLHERLAQPLDYAGMAENCHIALVTLRQQFRAAMGVPIHNYRMRVRLHAACNLISETSLPLQVIAEQLGYTDAAYFNRQFHQQMGITPGQLRRQSGSKTGE